MILRWLTSWIPDDPKIERICREELDEVMRALGEGWSVDAFEVGRNGLPWAATIRHGNATISVWNEKGYLEAQNVIDGDKSQPYEFEWPTRIQNLNRQIGNTEECCVLIRYLAEHHPAASGSED